MCSNRCAVCGALLGNAVADYYDVSWWKRGLIITGFAVGGAVVGRFAGLTIAKIASAVVGTNPGLFNKLPSWVINFLKITPKIGTTFGKLGTLVRNPKIIVDWARVTLHGLERMAERGMTKDLVNKIICKGKVLQQTAEKFMYVSKEGVVVVTKSGQIITAYSKANFDRTIFELVKKLF